MSVANQALPYFQGEASGGSPGVMRGHGITSAERLFVREMTDQLESRRYG